MPRKHEYFLFTLQKLFYSFILKLFDFSLKLKGFPIKEAQAFLKTIQKKQELDFDAYLETSKQDIVNYHLKHNPFYKDLAKHADVNDWDTLPVMTK